MYGCRSIKTQNEKEHGCYVKINNTESSFNNQVQTIMDSELSSRYAVIEHRQSFNDDEEITESNIECNKYTDEDFKRKTEILTNKFEAWNTDEEGDYMEFFNYWKIYKNYQKPSIKKQPKIFNIDINKCRKNILYYSNYDYLSYTVMDKITPYDQNKPLQTGCYYVESEQYFPLRGNGWYSLPMIEYCLENK